MLRTSLIGIVVCVLAANAATAQPRGVRSDQQILMQLERDWDRAFLHGDIEFLQNVLAEEFVATYDDGSKGDKAREIKLAQEFNQQVEASSLDDFTVKIYGETAIVWFSRHLAGPRQGKRVEVHFRFTDVFVLRDGRWQCVSSQSTKLAEAPAQR
jgi:ketosteroid isomerase-like protein